MSGTTWQHQDRWLRAPQQNRATLVDPPPEEIGALLDENVQLRAQQDYDFQGRTLADLSGQARAELLREARAYTAAYRDVASPPGQGEGPIFLAGHQPQMFHPGVWAKNFMLGELARREGAAAVSLVIDTDLVRSASLPVPGGPAHGPQLEAIPFDLPGPSVTYERRKIIDAELFEGFGRRAGARIAPLVGDALIEQYWPMAVRRMGETANLGACLSQSRHQLEAAWGLQTLEFPQSRVCESEPFLWFAAHLLAQLPRLRAAYNESLRAYRRAHGIRSAAHPAPDLAEDAPWLEAPLWISASDDPRRRRLFARQQGREIVVSDRQRLEIVLPLDDQGEAAPAVERLMELRQQGIRIRSRALITTLWARLVLGDLFLHGIGGAKYDRVTDAVIGRFFGLTPPEFVVFSGTLHLPVERPHVQIEQVRRLRQELRRLSYHPERFVDGTVHHGVEIRGDPDELSADKARWINTPQTPQNARERCRAIRRINAALQPWVEVRRRRLQAVLAEKEAALRAERILSWREYSFCLYPEKTLCEFLPTLLHKTA